MMNFLLKPQLLEHIAAVKVAGMLWNQHDIMDVMSKFSVQLHDIEQAKEQSSVATEKFFKIELEWLKNEYRVKENVPQLLIPDTLKDKILHLIKPVGFQILKWLEYNHMTYLCIDLPQEFFWTPHGTLDKKKTAESLVNNESIDITERYKLSCIYCLENSVRELWTKMCENCQSFDDEDQPLLVDFWTCNIKGELAAMERSTNRNEIERMFGREESGVCSPYEYAFEHAADDGNVVAVEYFYQKLTSSERKGCLVPIAGMVAFNQKKFSNSKPSELLRENYSDVLCFLLSKMNYEQQIELLKKFPLHVLVCLLDWPWQVFFDEAASMATTFIPPKVYHVLLFDILNKVLDGCKCFNYQEMFAKNWRQSSYAHKRNILNGGDCAVRLFVELFRIRDEGNIRLIFRDATLQDKKNIVNHPFTQEILEDLINNEEWGLLDYFLRECVSSKVSMKNFKGIIERFIIGQWSKDELKKKENIRDKCLELVDNIINDFDK